MKKKRRNKNANKNARKKVEFIDDGRVIANMNVEGMPHSSVRRKAFDEFGSIGEVKKSKEDIKISKAEKRSLLLGVIMSHVLFILMVFGGFALFIFFCTEVWFK